MSLKCTLELAFGPFQSSEVYVDMANTDITSANAIKKAQNLAKLRSNLLGADAQVTVVRLTDLPADRLSQLVFQDTDPNNPSGGGDPWLSTWLTRHPPPVPGLASLTTAEPGRMSLVVQVQTTTKHRSQRYLAFLPDGMFFGPRGFSFAGATAGPLNGTADWAKFSKELTTNVWGIQVKPTIKQLIALNAFNPVTGVVNDVGSQQLKVSSVTAANIGDYVQLRGVKGLFKAPKLNKVYRVSGVATGALVLAPAYNLPNGWVFNNTGQIAKFTPTEDGISALKPLYATSHKRGNSGFQKPKGKVAAHS
jgi:hypothetical protein